MWVRSRSVEADQGDGLGGQPGDDGVGEVGFAGLGGPGVEPVRDGAQVDDPGVPGFEPAGPHSQQLGRAGIDGDGDEWVGAGGQ
jgi:hypothetical protein